MTIVFNRCTPTSYNFIAVALQAIKFVHDKGGEKKISWKNFITPFSLLALNHLPYTNVYAHFVSILHRLFYSRPILHNYFIPSTHCFISFSFHYVVFLFISRPKSRNNNNNKPTDEQTENNFKALH